MPKPNTHGVAAALVFDDAVNGQAGSTDRVTKTVETKECVGGIFGDVEVFDAERVDGDDVTVRAVACGRGGTDEAAATAVVFELEGAGG